MSIPRADVSRVRDPVPINDVVVDPTQKRPAHGSPICRTPVEVSSQTDRGSPKYPHAHPCVAILPPHAPMPEAHCPRISYGTPHFGRPCPQAAPRLRLPAAGGCLARGGRSDDGLQLVAGVASPNLWAIPGVIRFHSSDSIETGSTFGERLRVTPRQLGLSHADLARRNSVGPKTHSPCRPIDRTRGFDMTTTRRPSATHERKQTGV